MKSLIRTIIVLTVLSYAMASYTLAQGGFNAGASAEAGTDSAVATSSESKEPVFPTPPSSVTIVPTAPDEFAVLEEVAVEPPVIPSTGRKMMSVFVGGKSSNMLVIPDTEIKTEDVTAITQDMQVMSHIFNKIFKGPRLIGEMFVDYGDFFGRGSRATQAIYLQGYGTLFVMEVDFPFSPPAESKDEPKDTKEGDSVWNQAKQEMFFPTAATTRTRVSAEMYDAEKVEELKTRLIKALKHATNIRNLKPEEQIILTVIGKSRSYGGGGYGGGGYSSGGAANISYSRTSRRGYSTTGIFPGGISIFSNTVLTIRAKKSDVDAFAKGDLDYEKFREKVQILKYYSLGQNAGSVSFTRKRIELPLPSSESNKDAQF